MTTRYIKDFIQSQRRDNGMYPRVFWEELHEELGRFDPRDFEPSVQALLLECRYGVRHAKTQPMGLYCGQAKPILEGIIRVFDQYRGEGSYGVQRVFAYIADPDLQRIIDRDYAELRLKLFPSGAWKSTVIMAGSILEAVLFDRLADPVWNPRAVASSKARNLSGADIPMKDWKLERLIDVAVEIGRLPLDPANTIHQVLRDYRNFVHPKKEVRAAHELGEPEALMAVGALDSVCNYFERNP